MKKRVLVTGASGFLGGHVCQALIGNGAAVFSPPRTECNLLDLAACIRSLTELRPEVVVHLAATVGGIGANQREPGRFFYENALMGMNLIEACRLTRVRKVVQVGTVCSYPSEAPIPFREADLWNGFPEPTNAPYGIAKKALLTMLDGYRKQYGLEYVYLIPANLYGPGDNFDPDSSHVIPALIRKFRQATINGAKKVSIWGTGKPTREFLYVTDAADAIMRATVRKGGVERPINLGGFEEISIANLSTMVASHVGYFGRIAYDHTKPDGQMRRRIDSRLAKKLLGWGAKVPFKRGLAIAVKDVLERWVNY